MGLEGRALLHGKTVIMMFDACKGQCLFFMKNSRRKKRSGSDVGGCT